MIDWGWRWESHQSGCLVWALLKEEVVLDPLVSLSFLTVRVILSGHSNCVLCSFLGGQTSYWKLSAKFEQVELKVIQAPYSPSWGKVVNKKQKAKKVLTHGGPVLSQVLERLWVRGYCHVRKRNYAGNASSGGSGDNVELAWNALQRTVWCGASESGTSKTSRPWQPRDLLLTSLHRCWPHLPGKAVSLGNQPCVLKSK